MSETTPQRTEPPGEMDVYYLCQPQVPHAPAPQYHEGARRYHVTRVTPSVAGLPIQPSAFGVEDSPEYQDAALARLHAQYDRAHLAFGIVFCVWLVTLVGLVAWAIYVFTR